MPAAISEFVDVNVVLTGAAAEKFSFGSLLGAFDHAVSANRQEGPYSSLAEVAAAGFTAASEPEVNAWATAVFSQDDGVDSVLVGHTDGIETWTDAYNAIVAADPGSFYLFNAETRDEAEIQLIAAAVEASGASSFPNIYIPQSSDADLLAGTAGNVGEDLQGLAYKRTGLIYHASDDSTSGLVPPDGYLDGAWSSSGGGLQVDAPDGQGTWFGRQLEGVAFDPVTSAEASALYGVDCNLFGRNKGLSFTSKGTAASGQYLDVTVSLDWLRLRLEEEILSTLVGAGTKIPFTNAGIGLIEAAVHAVFDRGVLYGHLSPDFPRTVTFPDVADISDTDKANRELTGTGNVVLAGAIHKVTLNINVQQ